MKKKSILFGIISTFCLALASGCGEQKYTIQTQSENSEFGYISGAGSYSMGSTVSLKLYPNVNCSTSGLVFIKNGTTDEVDVEYTQSDDGSYSFHDFALREDTIGKYIAKFTCPANTTKEGESEVTKKYKVRFIVKNYNGNNVNDTNPFNYSDTDYLGGYREYTYGSKLGNDVLYISNKEEYKNLSFTWYIDESCTTEYNFSNGITGDLTLYGKGVQINEKDEVTKAIEEFKNNTTGVVISTNDEKAFVKDLKNVDSTVIQSSSINAQIKVTNADNVSKYLYNASTTKREYFEFKVTNSKTDISKITLSLNGDDYSLAQMDQLYKFIKIKNVVINTVEQVEGELGSYIINKDGTDSYKVKLENGALKEFTYNEVTYTISYETVSPTPVGAYKDMYYVKIFTDIDNEIIKGKLNEANASFEKVIKVVQSYGETLEGKIDLLFDEKDESNSDFIKELKKYEYRWTTMNGTACVTDDSGRYNLGSYLSSNLNICMHKVEGIETVKNAILNTTDFSITATVNVFGDDSTKTYDNIASVSPSSITGVDAATGLMLETLEKLGKVGGEGGLVFDSMSYDEDTKEFKIFANDNKNIPLLCIVLDDNKEKLSKVSYYYADVIYTYTFGYSTTPAE